MSRGLINRRRALLYAIVVFLLLSVISFMLYNNMRGRNDVIRNPKKVVIAYVNNLHSALVLVAVKKGYFKDQGLDVVLLPQYLGKTALEIVLAGNADIATVTETPIMFNILKGKK
ncbi:MAG: ABC transporter substrate-binding protein, partial [Nitrospirae bacterium]|nr:ABC transporter substrate-binding protein [Nitrospirota bacterium]